ncbi:hypothetical protein BLX24_24295 [Arsenicibacter rosenii]|uniref:Uncharacterized protein n=1 Tax=Arsenicibacter rosenii TaxID=1750698 RepID=A0A1S2VDV0_9BACT|nr:hypothetical protein BLX24_24295 [Arsenicibacter rosenii]
MLLLTALRFRTALISPVDHFTAPFSQPIAERETGPWPHGSDAAMLSDGVGKTVMYETAVTLGEVVALLRQLVLN